MATYLIEAYAAGAPADGAVRLGEHVHVREELYIAADETWLCVVEAPSRAAVEAAARLAGVHYDRLTQAEAQSW